ncbi:MAG: terpene cyclase/mutase family protein [Planctomycetaceae bacterium]|nr:terpene cyclase/mutase family protein [Planctomycetaceae bacterium]
MTGITIPKPASACLNAPPRMSAGVRVVPSVMVESGEAECSLACPRIREDDRLPAVLISTIVHTTFLLLLVFFTLPQGSSGADQLTARQGQSDTVVVLRTLDAQDDQRYDKDATMDTPVEVSINTSVTLASIASEVEEDKVEVVSSEMQQLVSGGGSSGAESLVRLPSGGGLSKRTPEGRLEYGEKYGATRESEQAVEAALAWLAAHQRSNGSWSFNLDLDPCNGACRHTKKKGTESPTPSTGATGLALLAFLGAGHTHHHEGPYQETVRRGIYFLRDIAGEAGAGLDWQQGSMYGHGIALMALSEALAMTSREQVGDADLHRLVSRGASFTCNGQHENGSWGYVPGSPGDMTVSAWQVLSLVAAKKNRVDIHTNALSNAKAFVLSTCKDRDFWFGYKGPPGEETTTAIGLALMLYLGQSTEYTPFYNALTDLADRGPKFQNVYHDYYATLALHHSRHHAWDEWNSKLRDHLVRTQAKKGHEAGSWHFADPWGDIGGRLYTTAMCAMTLEVYYRYMPLYEKVDDFPL